MMPLLSFRETVCEETPSLPRANRAPGLGEPKGVSRSEYGC